MKYRLLLISLFYTINCIAMDIPVDLVKYNEYVQRRCQAFSGIEREKLQKLANVVVQKENPKRYELVAICLKEIYEHSKQLDFLGCAIELLNPSKTIHLDFNKDNSSVSDIYEKINYPLEDGPSEDDSDI